MRLNSISTRRYVASMGERWRIDHPEDKLQVVAYQCTHCNKYHIGHNRLSYRRLAPA